MGSLTLVQAHWLFGGKQLPRLASTLRVTPAFRVATQRRPFSDFTFKCTLSENLPGSETGYGVDEIQIKSAADTFCQILSGESRRSFSCSHDQARFSQDLSTCVIPLAVSKSWKSELVIPSARCVSARIPRLPRALSTLANDIKASPRDAKSVIHRALSPNFIHLPDVEDAGEWSVLVVTARLLSFLINSCHYAFT